MILITGGARSGKSLFGENLLLQQKKVLYIATAIAFDNEMKERVKIHQQRRNKNWDTLEMYKAIGDKLISLNQNYDGIIVDCITIMITNLIMQDTINFSEDDYNNLDYRVEETKILYEMQNLTSGLREMEIKYNAKTIIITNEVGSGIVPETKLSREFRDIAGRVNQYLAKEADEVYCIISGIPLKLKGYNL